MGVRSVVVVLAAAGALLPASASGSSSVGSHEQIAWVRRAATNFVEAELRGNGAGVCAVLNAPLRAVEHARTCAQRWDAQLAHLLRRAGSRASWRSEARAIPAAVVVVHGYSATIQLPRALMSGPNRFRWSENCWMLAG